MRLANLLMLLFLPLAVQAQIFKCQDKSGHITYTNSACEKEGLKEARIIPPPPAIDSPRAEKYSETNAADKPAAQVVLNDTKVALNKAQTAKVDPCANFNAQIGKVMDEMDAARQSGFPEKREAEWNARIANLQAARNRLGCF